MNNLAGFPNAKMITRIASKWLSYLHSNFQRVKNNSGVGVNITPYGGVTLFGVITDQKIIPVTGVKLTP